MYAQVQCPQILPAEELDKYLAHGWFRMGQTIFTTNFLNFKNKFYSALWLRTSLKEFTADKTYQKLTKLNARFSIEVKEAMITPTKEAVYQKYKQVVSFTASASLQSLLYGKCLHNIYNTYEVNIYDNGNLIAAGFFDLGATSAAGIVSFYDPAYRKYSLGKYLIYLKMRYCQERGMQYFYPGYFVPEYSFFDYKLNIATHALQFFELHSQQWLPISAFSPAYIPLKTMQEKLEALQNILEQQGIYTKLLKYEFFEANLFPELQGVELFDFPLFLYSSEPNDGGLNSIMVYDVLHQCYHLIKCVSVWPSNITDLEIATYSSHVLKIEQILFSSATPEEMVSVRSQFSSIINQ